MKKILAFILSTCLVGTMVACKSTENTTASNKEVPLEKVSIVLDWYPNAVHSFIYTAIEKGYYQDEGIEVQIRFPSNATDPISLPAANQEDLGIFYLQDIVTTSTNQNIPIKVVGTLVNSPLNIILSLKEKNITTAKDLAGKIIGYSSTELSEAIIHKMLENAGVSETDVTLIDVGFELMSAMTTHQVDATIGCLVNHEVPAMEKEGFEVNYFFPQEYGIPEYYELVLVSSEDTINKKSESIKKFLKASQKGFEYTQKHPAESLEILLNNQNEENFPLIEEVEVKSLDMLLPLMDSSDKPFLYQDSAVWQKNIDWLYDQGLLNHKREANDFIVNLIETAK